MKSAATNQQPEALALLAAAARSNGVKPKNVALNATKDTAPLTGNLKQQHAAAETLLREGGKGDGDQVAKAIQPLTDRTRRARKT